MWLELLSNWKKVNMEFHVSWRGWILCGNKSTLEPFQKNVRNICFNIETNVRLLDKVAGEIRMKIFILLWFFASSGWNNGKLPQFIARKKESNALHWLSYLKKSSISGGIFKQFWSVADYSYLTDYFFIKKMHANVYIMKFLMCRFFCFIGNPDEKKIIYIFHKSNASNYVLIGL